MRIWALLHTVLAQCSEEVKSVSQQGFYFVAQLESDIVQERKRRSLPHSVAATESVLFTSEDLKVHNVVTRINSSSFQGLSKTIWKSYLCTRAGGKGFRFCRFAPGKGFGFARGLKGGYGSYSRTVGSYGSAAPTKGQGGKGNKCRANTIPSLFEDFNPHFGIKIDQCSFAMAAFSPNQIVETTRSPTWLQPPSAIICGFDFHNIVL